jgi:hypothetical protein
MSDTRRDSVERLAYCSLEPLLGGISIISLGELRSVPDHPAMNQVSFQCAQGCGLWLEGPRFFSSITSCDACRAKADHAEQLERAKTYWEAICPPSFRETNRTHPGFAEVQYAATKDWMGGDSLFFFGPSGKGKSRLAMLLLKRCLVRSNMHVGVMWPEQLKAVRGEREVLNWIARWGKYDVLLMDDALLAAASDGRCADAFKDLLDYRLRFKRPNIVTSQIGEGDVSEQMAKFGKDTKADRELVTALWRRLRETCRVISFADAAPKAGEEQF